MNNPVKVCFCSLVLLLAVFQFSENTADPDLWGHITFGRHMLETRSIPRTEFYSWTAKGQPWVNHECIAEAAIGGTHAAGGGGAVLLLKILVGLAAFGLALRAGGSTLSWPGRYVAWGLAALAVVEISYGFAARPQIFTALLLALELWLLRRAHAGSSLWLLALPPMFALWVNTHGGVLAGFGLLGLCAGLSTAQVLLKPGGRRKTAGMLWLALAVSGLALIVNPWGIELVRWLIGSVLWLRPQIEEWNPAPFGWDHAAFFFLVALALLSWGFTRRPRAWWEVGACAAFALLGLRSVRNAPLFALVALAVVPPHLADILARFRQHFQRALNLWSRPGARRLACLLLAIAALATAASIFTLHKEHPLTMEVPRSQYPVGAISFIRQNELRGNLLVFFDWGEQAIFELPACPPSIDGRLDTCYSRELIAAHWKLYNGEAFDKAVLDPDKADLALLPSRLAGTRNLAARPGWRVAYYDDLAAVLIRDAGRFPRLQSVLLPVEGPKAAVQGRAPFPDQLPGTAGVAAAATGPQP